jgi:hypothetical protein
MIDEPFLDPDWQKISTSFFIDLLNPDPFKRSALAIHLPLSCRRWYVISQDLWRSSLPILGSCTFTETPLQHSEDHIVETPACSKKCF